jgi:hypothetical protein
MKIACFVLAAIASSSLLETAQAQNVGDTITTSIVLNRDLVETSGYNDGLKVGADNITIDGNGHSIICTAPVARAKGINVGSYSNVTIKNLRIGGFAWGIESYNYGSGLKIENCRLESNTHAAITLTSVTNATVSNCFIREPAKAFQISNSTVFISNNTIVGSRGGLVFTGSGLTAGSLVNNRFIHQQDVYPFSRKRMLEFVSASRQVNVGNQVDFSLGLSTLTGESTAGLNCTVRIIPETPVTYSRSNNTVSGNFQPTRNGVYSILASVTDTYGNVEGRVAKVFVGPLSSSSHAVYYMHDYSDGPVRGQAPVMLDNAGMKFAAPTKFMGDFRCGTWVDWFADELPPPPAALVQSVEVKAMLEFDGSSGKNPTIGVNRTGQAANSTVKVSVPYTMGTKKVEWGEFDVGPLNWILDYPEEWYTLTMSFITSAQNPRIYTGNPTFYGHPADRFSRTIFQYATTASPEVRAISDQKLLLLAATAVPQSNGGEELTVWGANNQADLTLANFRRPFIGAAAQISATGETTFNSGVVNGEKTFAAVPLEISPVANAVNVTVGTWNTTGDGRREWTEAAVGAPGTVAHTLGGLSSQTTYRVTAGGSDILVGKADAQGQLVFGYGGPFPVTFVATPAAVNHAPVISTFDPATPFTMVSGATQAFVVDAWDADGDALSYSWEIDGAAVSVTGDTMSYSPAAADAGAHTIAVTVSDGKGGSVTQTWSVTVTAPANQAPTVATAAKAVPSPATGATTVLSVLGTDDGGEANLTYTWATTGTPPAAVSFSVNGTNAAKSTTANFTKAGSYSFQVTIRDVGNLTVTSSVNVTVNQTLATVTVSPASASVATGAAQQFAATAKDQFGANLTTQPAFTWTVSGGGTVSSAGMFTAGATAGGPYTVTAASGGKSGTASVTVTAVATAPTITTQPASQTVTAGQTATFSVVAAGTAPLSYQWQKNGAAISGATGASYTTPATTTADSGAKFKVVVTNSAGNATSNEATLTVTAVNALVAHWKLDETGGTSAADATGNGYTGALQNTAAWTTGGKIDGALQLTGANDMFLSSSKVVPLGAEWTICGWFTAPLPNTGTWHTLTRSGTNDHHIITDGSLNLGMYDNATGGQFRGCGYSLGGLGSGWHHVAAVGSGTTTKFYVNGVAVGTSDRKAASSDVYAVGNYQGGGQRFADKIDDVRVYNYALAEADIAVLVASGATAPTITTQPASVTVTVGQTATFSVTAAGTAPLSYQWYKNGAAISGATGASYTTPATTTADSGAKFKVVVTNSAGSAASNEATLTVTASGGGTGLKGEYFDNMDLTALKLTRTDATVNFDWGGGSPDSSIEADSFSVRWTGQVQAQFSETYTFYTISDDGVRLWVNGVQVINNWTNHAPTENSGTISLVAGQKYDLKMEYYENGGGAVAKLLWSSASTAKQVVPQAQLYAASSVTPPSITTQPASATVTVGQTATFSVVASGTAPLSFRWQKNGADISGATAASYTTPATTLADNGAKFKVVVTNSAGSATSSEATLAVTDTAGPALDVATVVLKGSVIDAGGVAGLKVDGVAVTVNTDGSWQKEVVLSGATTIFTVTATDASGNSTSRTVTVTK